MEHALYHRHMNHFFAVSHVARLLTWPVVTTVIWQTDR